MSKYRPLYSNLWNDPDFENFTVEQKLIFIFLITNSAVEKSGIYKITIKQISFYTDIQKEVINEFFNKLINLGKIKYDFENGIIFIKNVFKFQKGMIKNKKIMFICLIKNYQMVKTEFWQDFFSLYGNDEIINEFINDNINKEIKDLIINKKSNETKKTKSPIAVNEECKSELINHNQNINLDFQEFWGNYPLQKTKVKGSKATSEKKYNLLREKGISKEELSNALANYQEEIKTNSWQQTKRVEFWLTKWEAYRQEDYSKELKFIESEVKKIEPLASIQVKDKNIIIKLPTFDSFRLNKEIINKNLGMLCENIGYKMQLIN